MRKKTGKIQPVEKVWLSAREACAYLDCSQDFLQALRDEAKISFSKLSSRFYLYDKGSIDKFIKKNMVV